MPHKSKKDKAEQNHAQSFSNRICSTLDRLEHIAPLLLTTCTALRQASAPKGATDGSQCSLAELMRVRDQLFAVSRVHCAISCIDPWRAFRCDFGRTCSKGGGGGHRIDVSSMDWWLAVCAPSPSLSATPRTKHISNCYRPGGGRGVRKALRDEFSALVKLSGLHVLLVVLPVSPTPHTRQSTRHHTADGLHQMLWVQILPVVHPTRCRKSGRIRRLWGSEGRPQSGMSLRHPMYRMRSEMLKANDVGHRFRVPYWVSEVEETQHTVLIDTFTGARG